jgi:Fe2+ or Zn2+ uptake regulation protein
VVEIDDCFPPEFEQALARRHRFARINHRLEFFGVCSRCEPDGSQPGPVEA